MVNVYIRYASFDWSLGWRESFLLSFEQREMVRYIKFDIRMSRIITLTDAILLKIAETFRILLSTGANCCLSEISMAVPTSDSIDLNIIDFSSATAKCNLTRLDRKQEHNVLFQVCVFFEGQSENNDGHPGFWLAETFSASSFKPLIGIWQNLTGNKNLTSSTKSIFWVDQMVATASDRLGHFRSLLCNRWMEDDETWQESSTRHPLSSLCFPSRSENKHGRLGLGLAINNSVTWYSGPRRKGL